MANKERNGNPLHRTRSALPLANTAGQESFTSAERSWKNGSRSHRFIGEGVIATSPLPSGLRSRRPGRNNPINTTDPVAEIHGSASSYGQTAQKRRQRPGNTKKQQILTLIYSGAISRRTPASYSGGVVVGGPARGEEPSRVL
jgi:hypothetical protein